MGLNAASGTLIACDSAHTSAFRARMAASPSTRVCGRLRIIRPNIDVVLRFAVRAVSVQRAQNALAGKELGKGVGQIEYHCKRDQVIGARLPRCNARHLGRCRRPYLPGRCILGITCAHTISSSPQVIEVGRSCGGRDHRYLTWYRWGKPDLPRDSKGM
jgi:hypothetical protein